METSPPCSHKSLSPATERQVGGARRTFQQQYMRARERPRKAKSKSEKSESASGKSWGSWRQKYYCSCVNSCQDGRLAACPLVPAPKCVLKIACTPHKHSPELTKEKHREQKNRNFQVHLCISSPQLKRRPDLGHKLSQTSLVGLLRVLLVAHMLCKKL